MGKSYKLVPPDGGYGYVILVAASVNLTSTSMFGVCFGMIFNDFFTQLQMGSTAISLLTGINALSVAISGFMSGPLLKVMSRRKLALIGSAFMNLGVFGTVFVNTKAQLILCQGFLQCFGFGFLYTVSCTMLNEYFVEKRLFSVSFAQTLSAAAAMVAPMLVSWSMEELGFRGTLVVVSAVSLQTFVASALLQPVAWHMKRELVDDVQEQKLLLQMDNSVNEPSKKALQTPVVKLNDIETVDQLFPVINESNENVKPPIAKIYIAWVKTFLDWPLLKKFALKCGCYGAPVTLFVDLTYISFLPQFLYSLNWNKDQVKWALALTGFGDIAARMVIIFSSTWLNRVGSHPIYVAGLLLTIATKLGMLWVTDYTWTLAIMTIMGVSRCSISVLYPLVVSDCVDPEQFPSAMGISMMLFGIISMVMGPIVGAIRDATGDYTTMFLILIAITAAVVVAWTFELIRGGRKTSEVQEDLD